MGCGSSAEPDGTTYSKKNVDSKEDKTETVHPEIALKSAMLIQGWYRRFRARMEARQRCTWTVFQSLEYAGEQDQLKLYNFFNDLMSHLRLSDQEGTGPNIMSALTLQDRASSGIDSLENEDDELLRLTDPTAMNVPQSYAGARLKFPLTVNQIESLIQAFKHKKLLHARFALELLHEARRVLKKLPNINHPTTAISGQVTVCGDLHGKIDDLFIIFYQNGLPSLDNPYVFNGDFVDRGPHSVEIALILFAFLTLHPTCIYINRGNHEDHVMNLRYGFIKEVMSKYKNHATKVVRLFEDVFSWLPLATVIDQKILVTHGGISDKTDLKYLATIDRHKYLSALRPPVLEDKEGGDDTEDKENVDLIEWRQVLDILWSDPKPQKGCSPNTFRGGGSYFGPDVSEEVLDKHNMSLLVRSHECKPDGYEYAHNNRVLTIFSASNYYEIGSNKGAYVKFGPDLKPRVIQHVASKSHHGRKITASQKVNRVEKSALRSLREKIYAHKSALIEEFQMYDPPNIGMIKVADWCQAMTTVLKMDLPWRSLRHKLVRCNDNGLVEYHSILEELKLDNKLREDENTSNVTEALYRNKENLETMFRAIDKDNSGLISMQEFEEACVLLSKHINNPMTSEQIWDIARTIDINKDGNIDFNEFLEAFRIVDQFGREFRQRMESLKSEEGFDRDTPLEKNAVSSTDSPLKGQNGQTTF